jgi:hypothetical protein
MVDQGLRKIDEESGREYFAYGGDFGDEIFGTDYQFCINVRQCDLRWTVLPIPTSFLSDFFFVDRACFHRKGSLIRL